MSVMPRPSAIVIAAAPLPLMRCPSKPDPRYATDDQKALTLETTRRILEDLLLPAGAEALPIRLVAGGRRRST